MFSHSVLLFSILRLISDLKLWNPCYILFQVIALFMLHNPVIIFLFSRYIHSHGYIYERIMYDRTSSYIDHSAPICAVKWQDTTWSLSGEPELTEGTWLQLMCCAPSRSRYPKFWSNGVHGFHEGILEYSRADGEDGID